MSAISSDERNKQFRALLEKNKKRKQIRAFFFQNHPTIPEESEFLKFTGTLFYSDKTMWIIGGLSILVALFFKDMGAGLVIFIIGYGLLILFSTLMEDLMPPNQKVEYRAKQRVLYWEKKEDWDKLLAKWGLNLDDLANKPTVAQIDAWLKEDMQSVTKLALNNLGLTREELVRDPMIIYGPLFWSTYGIPDDELVSMKISDGTLRFSCYQLVVVCLSAERIAIYSANFNFLRNVFLNEKTVEYLYRDIVSVSTEEKSTNYNLPNGKTLRRAQIFRLVVPSDNIEVVINSPEIKDLLGGESLPSDHAQSVRVIREMIRDKKG